MATQEDRDAAADSDWRMQRTLRLAGMDEVVHAARARGGPRPPQGETEPAYFRGLADGVERDNYLKTGEWITDRRSDPPGRRQR